MIDYKKDLNIALQEITQFYEDRISFISYHKISMDFSSLKVVFKSMALHNFNTQLYSNFKKNPSFYESYRICRRILARFLVLRCFYTCMHLNLTEL